MNIPNRLGWLRERSRLTQREVATITEIPVTIVNKHERGIRSLMQTDIEKYARLYKVPSYQIFVDPEQPTNEETFTQETLASIDRGDRMEGFEELHPTAEPTIPGLPRREPWAYDVGTVTPFNHRKVYN